MGIKQGAATAAIGCFLAGIAVAQNSPGPTTGPGPTNPVPPNPQSQPGADIVLNPTADECKRGWDGSLRWTKEQFDSFCTRLGTSK